MITHLLRICFGFLITLKIGYADTLVWDYSTGWKKGFVLTVDSGKSLVTFHDRDSEKKWSRTMNNSQNSMNYLALLMKKIPGKSIGQSADDGPKNVVTLLNGDKKFVRTLFDVRPPGTIFFNKDYPVETEMAQAEQFLRTVDGFLLLSQLEALKLAYFRNPEKLWWAREEKKAMDDKQ